MCTLALEASRAAVPGNHGNGGGEGKTAGGFLLPGFLPASVPALLPPGLPAFLPIRESLRPILPIPKIIQESSVGAVNTMGSYVI